MNLLIIKCVCLKSHKEKYKLNKKRWVKQCLTKSNSLTDLTYNQIVSNYLFSVIFSLIELTKKVKKT